MRHEKIKQVTPNNRRKELTVQYASGKQVVVHYGLVGIRKSIKRAWPDPETGKRSIVLDYADGSQDFMPYDQPLAAIKDPEYLLRHDLEVLTAKIRQEAKRQRVSLRHIARQLGTSDNQVQRLLNPGILNKNLHQLYRIAALLGLKAEFHLQDAA